MPSGQSNMMMSLDSDHAPLTDATTTAIHQHKSIPKPDYGGVLVVGLWAIGLR
jgi:hypothetical protein